MKVTKKAVQDKYSFIIELGYCQAQYLLHYQRRIAHTAGTYGWNADVFYVDGYAIVTGYRPFGNITPDYALVESYNEKARDILVDYTLDYFESKRRVNELLSQFINAVYLNL